MVAEAACFGVDTLRCYAGEIYLRLPSRLVARSLAGLVLHSSTLCLSITVIMKTIYTINKFVVIRSTSSKDQ